MTSPGAPGFHGAVSVPLIGKILSETLGPKADKAGTKTSAKTGPSAEAPASGEIEIEARFPLIEAINALGGRDVLLSATDLELITTKFPKATANAGQPALPSQEYRFVQGLQGKVSARVDRELKTVSARVDKGLGKVAIHMTEGDIFRIRWDFVPGDPGKPPGPKPNQLKTDPIVGKGLHVNAEFFGSTSTTKIAFTPSGLGPIVDEPTNRNPVRFDQIVKDQSAFLGYDTKPNTLTKVYSPEERCNWNPEQAKKERGKVDPTWIKTPEELSADQKRILPAMALKLAERWASILVEGKEPELWGKGPEFKGKGPELTWNQVSVRR